MEFTQQEIDKVAQFTVTDPPLSRAEYVRHFERLLESAEGWTDDGYTITHASGARLWTWQGRFRLHPVADLGGDELANLPGFGFWGRRKLWPKVEAVRRAVSVRPSPSPRP